MNGGGEKNDKRVWTPPADDWMIHEQRAGFSSWPEGTRAQNADSKVCGYCGKNEGPMHRDHLIPHSRGGGDDVRNCVLACEECNLSKSNMTPSEWKPTGLPAWIYSLEHELSARYKMKPRGRPAKPLVYKKPAEVLRQIASRSLVGNFFHTPGVGAWAKDPEALTERERNDKGWQGYVVSEVKLAEIYLVQLFSWIDGSPTNRVLVKLEELLDWTFFEDQDAMKWAYNQLPPKKSR